MHMTDESMINAEKLEQKSASAFYFEGNHIEIIGKTKRFTFKFRKALFDYSGGRCRYCGSRIENFKKMHVDHIVPKSNGGNDDIENLGCSCSFCNTSKGRGGEDDLRFNIALRERGINKIITPTQAKKLIEQGVDLKLVLRRFYYEGDREILI